MQIGELARRVGTSTDTVRFYERSGWLPRASRRDNAYREYGDREVEHLGLLIELRRLGMPLAEAAQIAGWCHAGHCAQASATLPALLATRRADVAARIAGLQALDAHLARLEGHLRSPRPAIPVVELRPPGASKPGEACCSAAAAIITGAAGCPCCTPSA
jgi:MerR family gold-responsive transcriptional activator of gol and ges genes